MADTEAKSIVDTELDEAAEAAADTVADAEIDSGQFVSHEKVVEWLKSWGTPDKLPVLGRKLVEQSCLVDHGARSP